jgi:hypothetical protein
MGGEDDLSASVADRPKGWKREEDSGIVRNVTFFVLRNIKIDPNKNPLPF